MSAGELGGGGTNHGEGVRGRLKRGKVRERESNCRERDLDERER